MPLPVSALLGVGAMIVGPRTAYRLTGSMLAAFLPAVAWLVVSVWLTLNRNDVMLTAPVTVTSGQWRLMLLLGLGALAAAATLALLSGDRLRDRIARERAAGGVGRRRSRRRGGVTSATVRARSSLRGILDVRCARRDRVRAWLPGAAADRVGRTCWQGPTQSMVRTCSLGPTP